MEIAVKGRNLWVTEALERYAFEKVERVAKFFDEERSASRAEVELTALAGLRPRPAAGGDWGRAAAGETGTWLNDSAPPWAGGGCRVESLGSRAWWRRSSS